MKTKALKNKLCHINFVRPLYKQFKEPSLDITNTIKLDGNDVDVTRKVIERNNCIFKSVVFKPVKNTNQINLPGACDIKSGTKRIKKSVVVGKSDTVRSKSGNMIGSVGSSNREEVVEVGSAPCDKIVQAEGGAVIVHRLPDTWLRVHPASRLPGETLCSAALRCVFCQLGLAVVLALWTVMWTFIIYAAEESFEIAVSEDFRKKQNQLVIDLATELRQITPISEKWRQTIESRIENERELTVSAVGRGARLEPGCFWSLAGTFLFAVYVMTALGFGAPVPQTLFGRTAAIFYAVLAVPTHIYLMVNLSTCIVARVDACTRHFDEEAGAAGAEAGAGAGAGRGQENSQKENQTNFGPKKNTGCRRKLRCLLSVIWFGHGVPLGAVVYYTLGAVAFGVLRGNDAVNTVMYPLDFTTSGGLEQIEGHVRFCYGLFVEGAMVLLACAVASLRRLSSGAIASATSKYRLFVTESCAQCSSSCDYT